MDPGFFSRNRIATAEITAGQSAKHSSGNKKSRILVLFLLYCLGQVICGGSMFLSKEFCLMKVGWLFLAVHLKCFNNE